MTQHEASQTAGSDVIQFPAAGLPTGSAKEELLSALFGRLCGKLTAYAAHYVGPDEADDVVQAAFVELWQRYLAGEKEPTNGYEAWLFGAVRFRVMDFRRVTTRHRKLLIQELWEYVTTLDGFARRWMETPARAEMDEFNKTIKAALDDMSPRTREVQVMQRKAGLTVAEICAATGLSNNSVRTLLQRGNRILRDHLDRAGYSPESRRSDSGRSLTS